VKRVKKGLFLLLWLVMLFTVGIAAAEEGPLEGDQAQGFTLKTLEGKPYGLKDALSGNRSVLLYFCATWCKDCKTVLPQVIGLTRKYADRLNVLGVNTADRDSLSKAIEYKKKNSLPYTVVFDEKDEITENYMVMGFPMFALVNPQGMIVYRGAILPQNMEKWLK